LGKIKHARGRIIAKVGNVSVYQKNIATTSAEKNAKTKTASTKISLYIGREELSSGYKTKEAAMKAAASDPAGKNISVKAKNEMSRLRSLVKEPAKVNRGTRRTGKTSTVYAKVDVYESAHGLTKDKTTDAPAIKKGSKVELKRGICTYNAVSGRPIGDLFEKTAPTEEPTPAV